MLELLEQAGTYFFLGICWADTSLSIFDVELCRTQTLRKESTGELRGEKLDIVVIERSTIGKLYVILLQSFQYTTQNFELFFFQTFRSIINYL